jgi:hypothetical protein
MTGFDHDSADVAPILEEVELAEAIEIDETWFSKRHQPDYGRIALRTRQRAMRPITVAFQM